MRKDPDQQKTFTCIKYWEILALLALLIPGLFYNMKKSYSLLLLSVSNLPLFVQALKTKQYNTAISLIFINKLVVIILLMTFKNQQLNERYEFLGYIFNLSTLICSIFALVHNRYAQKGVTYLQIAKEIGLILNCIIFQLIISNFGSFSQIVMIRVVIELFITAYLLAVKMHNGISALQIGISVVQKFYMILYLREAGYPLFYSSRLLIISIESINFILIMLFKYRCLKRNLSNFIKEKFNFELGDATTMMEKQIYDKRR